jgi:hypothetical protein
MGSLTNYGENAALGHLVATAYTPAATVYLALCTADPGEAATGASGNEVANANSYARTAISFGAASARRITQDATVTFPQMTGGSVTASHWMIVDSATYGAGDALAYGAFAVSKNLVNGSTPSVASAEVYVEFSAGSTVGFTNSFVNSFLGLMFDNTAYAQPATYAGLTTTTSSDSSAGTEVSGNNYARVLVNKAGGGSPAWTTVSGGAADNANAITFPTPSGSWGTVVGVGLWTASTVGTLLAYGNDVVDQAVAINDTVTFPTGAFDLAIT